MVRAPCARSQLLIAVPRTAGGFLSLLVQRKKPKKARPGWRKDSLASAALGPALPRRDILSRRGRRRHPCLRPSGRSPKALRCSGAPYVVLTKHLPDIHIGKWNDRFFRVPVAAAEHRRENREQRASCLSPRRVFGARRVEAASADFPEKRRKQSAAPGGPFFW